MALVSSLARFQDMYSKMSCTKRLAAEKKPLRAQLFYYVNQPAGKSEPQRAQLYVLEYTNKQRVWRD